MRRCSTLMEFITLSMIEYGQLIVKLQIPKVVSGKSENFRKKVTVWLGVCSKGVSCLVIFEDRTMDHDRYIKEVLPVALNICLEPIELSSKTMQRHTFMEWCVKYFPCFIDKDHFGPQTLLI